MLQNVLEKVKKFTSDDNNLSFRSIARFIVANIKNLDTYTIFDVARLSYTSAASVTRFCKRIGVNGYKELLPAIMFENNYMKTTKLHEYNELSDDYLNNFLFDNYELTLNALKQTYNNNKDCFTATSRIIQSVNKIYVFARGGSSKLMILFSDWMARLNYNIVFSTDIDQQYAYSKNVNVDDLALFVSYSGTSEPLPDIYQTLIVRQPKIIVITRNQSSPLTAATDVTIILAGNESNVDGRFYAECSIMFIMRSIYLALLNDEKINALIKQDVFNKE